ncbi:MAG: chaperone, ATP12 [Rhodospirillales bacterium]|nr:chaperone, ATP12 [Rhodospirillales bacterium]
MKRFWDQATIAPAEGGWQVELDGKPMRLPSGARLELPGRALAEAVAAEWQAAGGGAKGGETSFAALPLTRLAGTAQERIAPDPEPVILELARYGESDLLCYRAGEPEALVRRQAASWQPWLDWAAATLGARLVVAQGIVHVAQPPEALAALAGAVARHGAHELASLGVVVPALGSLVLALALVAGRLDAPGAHALASLDEIFQQEFWGIDEEAAARQADIARDLAVAERFLRLVQARENGGREAGA